MSYNPYKILAVDSSADIEVISAAYKALSKKFHPDVNNSINSKIRMQDINQAYADLKDPAKRAKIDAELFGDSNQEEKPPKTNNNTSKNYHNSTAQAEEKSKTYTTPRWNSTDSETQSSNSIPIQSNKAEQPVTINNFYGNVNISNNYWNSPVQTPQQSTIIPNLPSYGQNANPPSYEFTPLTLNSKNLFSVNIVFNICFRFFLVFFCSCLTISIMGICIFYISNPDKSIVYTVKKFFEPKDQSYLWINIGVCFLSGVIGLFLIIKYGFYSLVKRIPGATGIRIGLLVLISGFLFGALLAVPIIKQAIQSPLFSFFF